MQTSQANLLASNNLFFVEKQEHGKLKQSYQTLQTEHDKMTQLKDVMEADFKSKHEAEMSKVNMEAASKLLAEQNRTKDIVEKHDAAQKTLTHMV